MWNSRFRPEMPQWAILREVKSVTDWIFPLNEIVTLVSDKLRIGSLKVTSFHFGRQECKLVSHHPNHPL